MNKRLNDAVNTMAMSGVTKIRFQAGDIDGKTNEELDNAKAIMLECIIAGKYEPLEFDDSHLLRDKNEKN